ncbi:hypothetical protein AB0O47_39855 [Streptomyces noursei]|uniref:hypothetical protein n=1 Tax=Streptomyces noursei TaxID=1971 RepID=UPI00344CE94F
MTDLQGDATAPHETVHLTLTYDPATLQADTEARRQEAANALYAPTPQARRAPRAAQEPETAGAGRVWRSFDDWANRAGLSAATEPLSVSTVGSTNGYGPGLVGRRAGR